MRFVVQAARGRRAALRLGPLRRPPAPHAGANGVCIAARDTRCNLYCYRAGVLSAGRPILARILLQAMQQSLLILFRSALLKKIFGSWVTEAELSQSNETYAEKLSAGCEDRWLLSSCLRAPSPQLATRLEGATPAPAR